VFTTNYPSAVAPVMGTFVRERAMRLGQRFPIVVVAPQPWSPLDGLARLVRPGFRPRFPDHETIDGVDVYRPRYLSLPGVLKTLDGRMMARGAQRTVARLRQSFAFNAIDGHFLYPDGYAAILLGRRFGTPVTITLRGSKDRNLIGTRCEPMLREAIASAARLFAVSESLRHDVGVPLGVAPERIAVVANGVDLARFRPVDRAGARERLGIPADARVMIGVGSLVAGKGFQRVIPLVRALRARYPTFVYLIVGGGSTKGDMEAELRALARAEHVEDAVRFCGRQLPEDLAGFYGAADVFAMATEYEGWSNVLLEAMACGLPVVTTRVGGNPQVVSSPTVGELVDYWDADAFVAAVGRALERDWDRDAIVAYARSNEWGARIDVLEREFRALVAPR